MRENYRYHVLWGDVVIGYKFVIQYFVNNLILTLKTMEVNNLTPKIVTIT